MIISNDALQFGLVTDIIIFNVDDYFLVCEMLQTEYFNYHLHAYKVNHCTHPSFMFLKQTDLADHAVLGLYRNYVVLKYHVN